MSLFNILKSDSLTSTLGNLFNQAKNTASQAVSNAPGGVGGLLGAGALGAILGQTLSSDLMKNVALVGAGAVAWNFYQKWSQSKNGQPAAPAQPQANPWASNTPMTMEFDQTSMLIMRAMIYSARSDGNIDAQELQRIETILKNMLPNSNVQPQLDAITKETLDPHTIAQNMQSPEQAEDIYRLSCIVIDIDHFMERSYLDALGSALGLTKERCLQLEEESNTSKKQLAASVG